MSSIRSRVGLTAAVTIAAVAVLAGIVGTACGMEEDPVAGPAAPGSPAAPTSTAVADTPAFMPRTAEAAGLADSPIKIVAISEPSPGRVEIELAIVDEWTELADQHPFLLTEAGRLDMVPGMQIRDENYLVSFPAPLSALKNAQLVLPGINVKITTESPQPLADGLIRGPDGEAAFVFTELIARPEYGTVTFVYAPATTHALTVGNAVLVSPNGAVAVGSISTGWGPDWAVLSLKLNFQGEAVEFDRVEDGTLTITAFREIVRDSLQLSTGQ